MTRRLALLCSALLLASVSTLRGQTAAEADYILARREAADAYERAPGTFNQKAALANLERKLRSIIGPVNVPGFPQPGRINLETICRGEEGCETLDGLVYRTEDWSRRLIVTSPSLMTNWLGHGVSIDSALRTSDRYPMAFGSHAAALHYADLAVPDAQRRGIVSAMLILEAQDEWKWPPKSVVVSIVRKSRIYIMMAPTAVAIDTLPGCGARVDSVFSAKPDPRQITMEDSDRAYRSYRACYAERVSTIPGIERIIEQVMMLADAVPPTAARNYGLADDAALQGAWRVVDARARMSNEPAMIIDGLIDRGSVEFSGSIVTMRQLPHADLARLSFTLDTTRSPRQLRMIDSSAADGGRWIGLYRVSGDTLRLSLPISRDGSRPVPPASFNAPNTAAYILTRVPRNP